MKLRRTMVGIRNISAVFVLWPNLAPVPKLLFVGMAMQALDTPSNDRPARVFFGGEETMQEYTGRSRPRTYAALKVLREVGAVEAIEGGRSGHRAVYKLNLSTLPDEESGSRKRDAPGSRFRDVKGLGNETSRVSVPRPLGRTKEGLRRSPEEETSPQGSTSPAPVDNSGSDDVEAAKTILLGMAPSRYAAALQQANDEGIDESNAQIVRAAEIVKGNVT